LITVVFLRFVLSTSAHIIYSGLFGAFLVEMIIAKGFFHKTFKLFLALAIPIGIHTLYNVLVVTEYGAFSVPLIFLGFILLAFKAFWPLRKIN